MSSWLATILIFLPLAGALFIWLIPVGRLAGSFALLFALAEIGFWINGLAEFDFDGRGRSSTRTGRGSAISASRTTSATSLSRSGSLGSQSS